MIAFRPRRGIPTSRANPIQQPGIRAMGDRRFVCVFCGSSPGANPRFADAATEMGRALAAAGLGLVYGGGQVGLMGRVADAALAAGAPVVGVIPRALDRKEISHHGLTELHVVETMHERKALMAARADAFLTLPGGVGTFEEFFEILTWAVLGLHRKPMGILEVDGFYEPLLALIDHAANQQFARPELRQALKVDTDPSRLLNRLFAEPTPNLGPRWLRADET
jgi:uncharacterized protein (TIGR00730 family)